MHASNAERYKHAVRIKPDAQPGPAKDLPRAINPLMKTRMSIPETPAPCNSPTIHVLVSQLSRSSPHKHTGDHDDK